MGQIRPLAIDDIPSVARLYQRIFGDPAKEPSDALRNHLEEIFLRTPWRDDAIPSLVYEQVARIEGFLGVIPRPMIFQGRPIRVAVSSSLMVDPASRQSHAAIQLMKTFFAGPQDLSLTDNANDLGRRIWKGVGGSVVPIYSLYWTRPLRVLEYALHFMSKKRKYLPPITQVVRPLCVVCDPVAAKLPPNRFGMLSHSLVKETLDHQALLNCISDFSANESLRPHYDYETLKWLLQLVTDNKRYGRFSSNLIRDDKGNILGWYLYYQHTRGVGQVLQFAARRDAIDQVLDSLFFSAWQQGAIAIMGRLEPRFLSELSENYCLLASGPWMLVHSKNSNILQSIYQGDAFLSRLEGEWWIRLPELAQ